MPQFALWLFDQNGFSPPGNTAGWSPALIWLHVAADLFLWIAFISMPLVLLYFTRRRDLPYRRLFFLFAAFLLVSGFGFFIDALTFHYPLFRLAGVWKAVAAVVSWVAALSLITMIPRVITPASNATSEFEFGGEGGPLALAPSAGRLKDYIIAVLAGVLALLVRAAMDPADAHDHMYVVSLLAVVFVSWQCGFGPGIVTLTLSMLGMIYFFIPPRDSFLITHFGDQLTTAMFFFCGVCCAALGEAQRISRRRTKTALATALHRKRELEEEVARRKEVEESLRQSEATLRAFYDSAPVCMGIVEIMEDDILHHYDNAAGCRFFGVKPGETTGQRESALGTQTSILQLWLDRYRDSAAKGSAVRFEHQYEPPSGPRWLMATVSPIGVNARGRQLFCYVSEDVTSRREAEDAIRESQLRFRSMADSVPGLIWLSDLNRKRTYFNKTWLEFTGRSIEQELGDGWTENLHPDDRDRYLNAYANAFAEHKSFELEYRLRRKDGDYRWVLARGTPRFNPSGGFAGFVGFCLDMTDRRAADEAVRRSERNLSDFFDNANVGLHWVGPDGVILRANQAELDMLGYAADEYVGRRIEEFNVDPSTVRDILDKLAHDEPVRDYSARLRHKDGSTRDVLISSSALWEDGRFIHSRSFTRDVTELKHAEAHLRASEERYRTLTEAIPQIVWNAGPDGEVSYFNQRWRDYTGLDLDKSNRGGWLDAIHPDDRDRVAAAWQSTVEGAAKGTVVRFSEELRLLQSETDEYRWFLAVAVPLLESDGKVDQWVGSMADIHEQKTASAVVAESEEKFRTMAESIPQLAWMTDADGYIFWYNQRWYDFTGTTFDEMKGWGWQNVQDPNELPRVLDKFKKHIASGEPWEDTFPLRRRDGAMRWHLSRARPIRDKRGRIVRWFGTNTDITDQREMEQALRESAERFRTLTEAVPQMVWTADPRGELTFFNRRWDEYTGLPLDRVRSSGWDDAVHPDDAAALGAGWQEAVAARSESFTSEFRLRHVADGQYRWMLGMAVSIRDRLGSVNEWVGSITDIDDQKRQSETLERMVRERTAALVDEVEERKRAEQQVRSVAAELERSNGELEEFAYIASHDLQEPLRKIQAFGDRLRNRFRAELPDAGKEYVDRMHNSAGRMRHLIDDLLNYSRVTTQAHPFRRVSLDELVREVVADLDELIAQKEAAVTIGALPSIDADPTQMRQLLQNLIANAVKFQRPGEPPVVEIQGEVLEENFPGTGAEPVPMCRVTVRDYGIGFDEKYLDRIFQVFQRLHGRSEYEGSGVGLAICRKIVERHGGTITARSRAGEGAAFVVTLPVRQHSKDHSSDVQHNETAHHDPDRR